MDITGILSSVYGLNQPALNGQQQADGLADPNNPSSAPVFSDNDFFNSVAQEDSAVAASLLSAQSTSALFGFGQQSGSGDDLFSAFYGGTGGAGSTEALLSAYFANQIAPNAAVNTVDSGGTELSLDGGITVDVAQDATLGDYTLTFDAASETFTLTDGLGGVFTATDNGAGSVDFGNGIGLTLGASFDPSTSLSPQGFQLFNQATA